MNELQLKQGGGKLPAPYVSPEITLVKIRVEQGFAGSDTPGWSDDPTVGGTNPIDPYGPDSQSY